MGTNIQTSDILYPSFNFNAKYQITFYDIKKLKQLLCDKTFFDDFSLLFQNYADYINGIKYYPIDIRRLVTVGGSRSITLGNKKLNTIGSNVDGMPITSIKKSILIDSRIIPTHYNNFLDYEPYTKIELYIPYFGFMTLPTNEVMGKQIYVYLSVDFDTGIGTIYIQVEGRVILTNSSKIGIDVPIGSSNLAQIYKDNIANVMKIGTGVGMMLGGEGLAKLGGLAMAGQGALNMMMNSSLHYMRGSLTGGTDGLASPFNPYLVITRPNAVSITEDYNHIKGKPLNETKVLSTLRGFTVINDIHLEGFKDALDDEIKDIEEQMRRGIYL